MRILLIDKFHFRFGGAERAYFDTARVLREHGHEVAFFSMHHPDNEPSEWEKYFVDNMDLSHENYSLWQKIRMACRMIWNHQAQRNLRKLIAEFRPDVAHMHLIYHHLSPSVIWTLKRAHIPMVMTLHDYKLICPNYDMFAHGKIWDRPAYKCIMDRCVRNSLVASIICTAEHYFHALLGTFAQVDAYIAPSKFLIEKFVQHHFAQKITHVPQPLNTEDFAQIDSSAPNSQDGYILYVGRLSVEKGVAMLIEAFAQSHQKKLVIVGTGPEENRLRKLADEMSQNHRIEFTGYQTGEALRTIIAQSRAIVMPSVWYENMPYALLEALAAGQVVIVADSGGMPERIQNGRNGFLFPAGDVPALTRILDNLPDDDVRMRQLAQESVRDLTPERYYQKLMEIYTNITSQQNL